MTDTAVSLIIPIYNAAEYLQQCLDSVTAQTVFSRMQVLLIDDGSTDASPEICDVYAQKYTNIYVTHRRNAGVSAARNIGLELAVGKYAAFADADDLLLPDMIECLLEAAERTGAQMTFCDYIIESAYGEDIQRFPFPQNEAFGRDTVVRYMMEKENFNTLCDKLLLLEPIRAHALRLTVGRRFGEDREFVLHYLQICDTLVYVPNAAYFYRYVPTSAIHRKKREYATALSTQFLSDQAQFARLGVQTDDFIAGSAVCFCCRIAATIDVLCHAYQGFARLRMLRAFFADDAVHAVLHQLMPYARGGLNRYTRVLLQCMQRRLAVAARLWMRAVEGRVWLFERLHGKKQV